MSKQSFKLELYKNKLFNDITFVKSSYMSHEYPPHFHDHYVIMMVIQGVNEGHLLHTKYRIGSNEILVINPGEMHTGYSYQNEYLSYIALYLEPSFFGKTQPELPKHHFKDKSLSLRLQELYLTRFSDNKLELEEKRALCIDSLHINYAGMNKVKNDQKIIINLKSFIQDHYRDNFSLSDLSHQVSISEYHLIRLFKKHVGISPFQYLRNIRIERAKNLLRHKNTVSEIAQDVGFYDQSHFHKHFKRIVGTTPKYYQQTQQ